MSEFKISISSATMQRARVGLEFAWLGAWTVGGGWGFIRTYPTSDMDFAVTKTAFGGAVGLIIGGASMSHPYAVLALLGFGGATYYIAKHETERAGKHGYD